MAQPIPYTQVTIKSDFWDPIVEVSRQTSLRVIYEKLKSYGTWDSLRLESNLGRPVKADMILWDSDIGKYIEAASYALYHASDSELEARVEDAINMILNMQQEDGYTGFWHTVIEPGKRWSSLAHNLELYGAGHMLEAAVTRHIAKGCPENDRFLAAMVKYVRLIQRVFGEGEGQLRDYPGHQEIELALMRLYDVTGDRSLVDLARYFIEERGRTDPPRRGHAWDIAAIQRGDDPNTFFPYYWPRPRCYWHMQAHLPIREQKEIVGHSVQAMYWLSAVTDVALATGEHSYLNAVDTLWQNMVDKKMYVTGGIGSVHLYEGFGPEYDLPNETSYAETCAAIGVMFLAHRKLKVKCDAAVADVLELAMYNAMLAGISLDGKTFNYDNPLATVSCSHKRSEWFKVFCCPSNICRLLNSLGGYIYGSDTVRDCLRLTVHTYVASQVKVGRSRWDIQTEWPWNGKTRLAVLDTVSAETILRLRIPGWAENYTITLNGQSLAVDTEDGYISIPPRLYGPRDIVELDIPMTPMLIRPHPLVHQNRGCLAVRRGPFIYALESIDQDSQLSDLRLAQITEGAPLETFPLRILDKDVVGVKTIGTALVPPPSAVAAHTVLGIPDVGKQCVELKFIPYFAWGNRGPSDVRVWIPQSGKSSGW